jgi:hypothetical protein
MSELLFTHKRMREKIFETRAAIALLLGIKEIQWADREFALLQVMSDMWIASRKTNPTRDQVKVFTGAWLRFLDRLINELPATPFKAEMLVSFNKMARGYETFLSNKGAKDNGSE